MRQSFTLRIRALSIIVVLFALLLSARLYVVQLVHGDEFSARADHQYVLPTQEIYDRGSIFFEDKDGRLVSAATLKSGYILALNPDHIVDPEKVYNKLSTVIPLDEEKFFALATKEDDPYEEVLHRLTRQEANRIRDFDLDGVQLFKEQWRFYPGEELAAQTLGFVGFQGDQRKGIYGLERYYNDTLDRSESSSNINFFAEVFAGIQNTIFGDGTSHGDVVTYLEPATQAFLEKTLDEVHSKWRSRLTGGIIIDPKTGAIYALAVRPAYDPNTFNEVEDGSVFPNPLVEKIYEMGSIIKPITMAIGFDTGAIRPDTTYYDAGFLELDGSTISNFDGEGRGTVSMQEVLSQSLNTGAAFVALESGTERFAKYMKELVDDATGVDLPGEVNGLVSNLDSPRSIEYATASYGQGIAFTPIATVRALSALANGGVPVTPHVGKRINYESGLSKEISFPEQKRVFKQETTEEVTRMLVKVVDDALLEGAVKMPRYSIAAKTGTAQIAKVGERGYYDDRYLHSFFGYFPAYDPEFLVFLYTVEPKEVRYASQTLTHPFMDITQFLINYNEVQPDR